MDIKDLSKPLPITSIDFRIQSINKGGYATILAYKDARVDINRLNEVCGSLGWERRHTRENHNCIVSIWDDENKHWVSKEDTGTESNTEQQKGLASDSFKRACFNWGIGIELYDYPLIQIHLKADEWNGDKERPKATWNLKLKEWIWHSEFEENKLCKLVAIDNIGNQRFKWPAKDEQVNPEPIRPKVVERAALKYREILEADTDEPDYLAMQNIDSKITNDEKIAVANRFGDELFPGTKKKYINVIKECLKWHPSEK